MLRSSSTVSCSNHSFQTAHEIEADTEFDIPSVPSVSENIHPSTLFMSRVSARGQGITDHTLSFPRTTLPIVQNQNDSSSVSSTSEDFQPEDVERSTKTPLTRNTISRYGNSIPYEEDALHHSHPKPSRSPSCPSSNNSDKSIISMNPVMQSILGVDYLPKAHHSKIRNDQDSSSLFSQDPRSFRDESTLMTCSVGSPNRYVPSWTLPSSSSPSVMMEHVTVVTHPPENDTNTFDASLVDVHDSSVQRKKKKGKQRGSHPMMEEEEEENNAIGNSNPIRHGHTKGKRSGDGPISQIRKGLIARKERREKKRLIRQLSVDRTKLDGTKEDDMPLSPHWMNSLEDLTISIEEQQIHVGKEYKKLDRCKRHLVAVAQETDRIIQSASSISNRVSKLSKLVLKLECQLDMASKALEDEKKKLNQNVSSLSDLDALRQDLEQEVLSIQETLIPQTARTRGSIHSQMAELLPPSSSSTPTLAQRQPSTSPPLLPTFSARRSSSGSSLTTQSPMDDVSFVTALEMDTSYHRDTSESFRTAEYDEHNPDVTFNHRSLSADYALATDHNISSKGGIHNETDLFLAKNGSTHNHSTKEIVVPSPSNISIRHDQQNLTSYIRAFDLDFTHALSSRLINGSYQLSRNIQDCRPFLDAISKRGLDCAIDVDGPIKWIPERATERIVSSRRIDSDLKLHSISGKEIFSWSGQFEHGGYGSDISVIKARGVIPCPPRTLLHLLLDSSQVKTFNKMSLGRTDEYVYVVSDDMLKSDFVEETKVIRSLTKPPLIRKPIELVALMHARNVSSVPFMEGAKMKGYIIVTRSVWEDEKRIPTLENRGVDNDATSIRSELLLSVNLLREVEAGRENAGQCEITTVNHMYTPCLPSFGAKQLALKAACSFIRDLQTTYEQ